MKPLYIVKIGGSVATYKNRPGFSVRKSLLEKIANSIKEAQKKKKFDLILIHGAGAAGHQLAREYKLTDGTGKNEKKWQGAFLSRFANQRLDVIAAGSLHKGGLSIASVHTASFFVQKNKKITFCNLRIIEKALAEDCVPLLYGEMVFDERLGMSICSGDSIAFYLAKKLDAEKIFFATDTEGVFDKDPHLSKDARLIRKILLKNIEKIKLSGSHNIDATGGMFGKLNKLANIIGKKDIKIEIFNGLEPENYKKILLGQNFRRTIIEK